MPTAEEIYTAVTAAAAFEAGREILTQRPGPWPVMVRGWAVPTEPKRYTAEEIDLAWQREYTLQNTDGTRDMTPPTEALWPLLPVEPDQVPANWRVGLAASAQGVTISVTSPDGRISEMKVWQHPDADDTRPMGFGFQADFDFVEMAGQFTTAVSDGAA